MLASFEKNLLTLSNLRSQTGKPASTYGGLRPIFRIRSCTLAVSRGSIAADRLREKGYLATLCSLLAR